MRKPQREDYPTGYHLDGYEQYQRALKKWWRRMIMSCVATYVICGFLMYGWEMNHSPANGWNVCAERVDAKACNEQITFSKAAFRGGVWPVFLGVDGCSAMGSRQQVMLLYG